jgi:hypothetical protein
MTSSESFDPLAVGPEFPDCDSKRFSEAELLLRKRGASADLSQPPSVTHSSWQEQLLPTSCIAAEDSLTVLRAELERAHQLLQQQQRTVDAVKEQLTNRELQLQHSQTELIETQQTCERQSAKLAETDGICRDLKTQLRRQQQRVLQYRNLLSEQVSSADLVPFSNGGSMIAMGQDTASATKSGPVSAWSAPPIGLTGPLACYRELATIRMAPAQNDSIPSNFYGENVKELPPALCASSTSKSKSPGNAQGIRIELPTFTRPTSS